MCGGADAFGTPKWDFSNCGDAADACAETLAIARSADPERYPDPDANRMRLALAALHGVDPLRIMPATHACEFIQDTPAAIGRRFPGAVRILWHACGDYAAAARAWGRQLRPEGDVAILTAILEGHADPSNPPGTDGVPPSKPANCPIVVDVGYSPLRPEGFSAWSVLNLDTVIFLQRPKKSSGSTGARGAYAVAPAHAAYDAAVQRDAREAARPSWPLSPHAGAMRAAWGTAFAHSWVEKPHPVVVGSKAGLNSTLDGRGFEVRTGVTAHDFVRPSHPVDLPLRRRRGVAVRDTASFRLPGCRRLSGRPPSAHEELLRVLAPLQGPEQ